MAQIIPTILTNEENTYQKRLITAEHVSNLIQVDVIDGKFANNLTCGTDIIKKYYTTSLLEIQLMVVDPAVYIKELISCEYVLRIIIPFEVKGDHHELLYSIRNSGKQAGLSVNPQTPIKIIKDLLSDIDLLLVLAVDPGFAGQAFKEEVLEKVKESKKMLPELPVEVDGGVNFDNVKKIVASGANFLAANSVLYGAEDFMLAYEKLAKLASKTP